MKRATSGSWHERTEIRSRHEPSPATGAGHLIECPHVSPNSWSLRNLKRPVAYSGRFAEPSPDLTRPNSRCAERADIRSTRLNSTRTCGWRERVGSQRRTSMTFLFLLHYQCSSSSLCVSSPSAVVSNVWPNFRPTSSDLSSMTDAQPKQAEALPEVNSLQAADSALVATTVVLISTDLIYSGRGSFMERQC